MIVTKKYSLPEGNYRAFSNGCRNYCDTHIYSAKTMEVIQNSPFFWAAYHIQGFSVIIKSFETIHSTRHLDEQPLTEISVCGDVKLLKDIEEKLNKISGNKLVALESKLPEAVV